MSKLLQSINELIKPEILTAASISCGEAESATLNLMKASMPCFLYAIQNAPIHDYDMIADLLGRAGGNHSFYDDVMNSLHSGSMNSPALSLGDSMLNVMFEDDLPELIVSASKFAIVKPASAHTLLAISAALLAAYLGRKMLHEHLSTQGLLNFLQPDKLVIANLVPASLMSIHTADENMHVNENKNENETILFPMDTQTEEKNDGTKWILPLLLLGLLGVGIWYWMMGSKHEADYLEKNSKKIESIK